MKKLFIPMTLIIAMNSYTYRTQDMHYEFHSKEKDLLQQQAELKRKIDEKQQAIDTLNNDITGLKMKVTNLKKQCPKNPIMCLPSSLQIAGDETVIKTKQLELDRHNESLNQLKSQFNSLQK